MDPRPASATSTSEAPLGQAPIRTCKTSSRNLQPRPPLQNRPPHLRRILRTTTAQLPHASIIRHSLHIRVRLRDSQTRELAQNTRVATSQFPRLRERVHSASPLQTTLALARRTLVIGSEKLSSKVLLSGLHIVENTSFDQDVAGRSLKRVPGVVGPVVVDGMEESVLVDLWRAAGGVVDVVALEGNLVILAREEESPVVFTVAAGGIFGLTIEVVVGNGDASVRFVPGYKHHAADIVDLHGELDRFVGTGRNEGKLAVT